MARGAGVLAGLFALGLLAQSELARGAPSSPSPEKVLQRVAQELENDQPSVAIRALERLADEGVAHPDVSFTRGLAYLRRGQSADRVAGDLGQAAAGFREALVLRPGDAEAAR